MTPEVKNNNMGIYAYHIFHNKWGKKDEPCFCSLYASVQKNKDFKKLFPLVLCKGHSQAYNSVPGLKPYNDAEVM